MLKYDMQWRLKQLWGRYTPLLPQTNQGFWSHKPRKDFFINIFILHFILGIGKLVRLFFVNVSSVFPMQVSSQSDSNRVSSSDTFKIKWALRHCSRCYVWLTWILLVMGEGRVIQLIGGRINTRFTEESLHMYGRSQRHISKISRCCRLPIILHI